VILGAFIAEALVHPLRGFHPSRRVERDERLAGGAGARLVPMRMTGERFTAYVRGPRTPQMPTYSTKLLTDAQLADLWAYIKSMPASPEAKDIPLLARIMSGR